MRPYSISISLPGIISDSGNLIHNGAGITTLSGVNNFIGIDSIRQGTVSVSTIGNGGVAGGLGAASNAAANIVLGGGGIQYTGITASTDRSITLIAATTSTINITSNTLTDSGTIISTSGALIKAGAGTLILANNCTYTGLTTITGGTLQLNINNTLPTTDSIIVKTGGTLRISGVTSNTLKGVRMEGGTLIIDAGSTLTLTNLYDTLGTGSTPSTITNNGTITITGNYTSYKTYVNNFNIINFNSTYNSTADTINNQKQFSLGSGGTTAILFPGAGSSCSAMKYIITNGPVTLNNDITNLNDSLSITGAGPTRAFSTAGFILSGTGKLIMSSNTNLNLSRVDGTTAQPYLSGTYNLSPTSSVNFNATGTQVIRAVNYGKINMTPTSGSGFSRILSPNGVIGLSGITTPCFTPSTAIFTVTGSTVNYNGTGAQTIAVLPTAAAAPYTNQYGSLVLSGTGSKSYSATQLTILDSIRIEAPLNITNAYINLKSDASKTARVAYVAPAGTITYGGTSRFVVERYYPAKRAWHLTTAPVTADATRTMFSSWQTGGASVSGSGTYITSPTPNAGNGMDASPQFNYSLKKYNIASQAFINVDSTKTLTISGTAGIAGSPDNVGYFLFVRGDRTASNLTPPNCNTTILRDTGKIQTGTETFASSGVSGHYTFVGNPYASPVDFNRITLTNSLRKFWTWDPGLNSVGGYVLVDGLTGTYVTSPSTGTTVERNIQSTQSFFVVDTSNAAGSIIFNETNKTDSSNNAIFRTASTPGNIESLTANLFLLNADSSVTTADGFLAQFSDAFSANVDFLDGVKFGNVNEQISLVRNNISLAIERRPIITDRDTLFIKLTKTTQRNYRFQVNCSGLNHPGLEGYLMDKYTGIPVQLSLNGNTQIDFQVNADQASSASNRFMIVFKPVVVLPVNFNYIKAWALSNNQTTNNANNSIGAHQFIQVQWGVENQGEVNSYIVEKSADGIHFNAAYSYNGSLIHSSSAIFNWIDSLPEIGLNYYRIKFTGLSGEVVYSEVVKVQLNPTVISAMVYPNPIKNNTIHLEMNGIAKGFHDISLSNSIGQIMYANKILNLSEHQIIEIHPSQVLPKGVYQLKITNEVKETSLIKLIVE